MNTRLAPLAALSLLASGHLPAGELERNVARLMPKNEFIRTLVVQSAGHGSPGSMNGINVSRPPQTGGNIVRLDFIPVEEREMRNIGGYGRIQTPRGAYGVEGHGDPGVMFFRNGQACPPAELARWIRHDRRYTPGMTVYLFACETGKGSRCFAQRLADELNARVVAPTEKLWLAKNGGYTVAREQTGRLLGFIPAALPHADNARTGAMKTFAPKATAR
jgi:hypothetical protein